MDEELRLARRAWEETGDPAAGLRVLVRERPEPREAFGHPWLEERSLRRVYGEHLQSLGDPLGDWLLAETRLEEPGALSAEEESRLRHQSWSARSATQGLEPIFPEPPDRLEPLRGPWPQRLVTQLPGLARQGRWILHYTGVQNDVSWEDALGVVLISSDSSLPVPSELPALRYLALTALGDAEGMVPTWLERFRPQLFALEATLFRGVQTVDLAEVAWPRLERLAFTAHPAGVSDLTKLRPAHFPLLRELSWSRLPSERVLPVVPQLERLALTTRQERAPRELLAQAGGLEALSLTGFALDAEALGQIVGLSRLRELSLKRAGLDDAVLEVLSEAAPLRSLSLGGGDRLSPAALGVLLRGDLGQGLRYLDLRRSNLEPALFLELIADLELPDLIGLGLPQLTPPIFARLSEVAPRLTHLLAESVVGFDAPLPAASVPPRLVALQSDSAIDPDEHLLAALGERLWFPQSDYFDGFV